MASSCSFRITRTTEDLAQTITALSQRLIKLEQRFEAIELQLSQPSPEMPVNEIAMLDGIDQQLKECKELLGTSDGSQELESEQIEVLQTLEENAELIDESDPMEAIESMEEVSDESWIEEPKEENIAA